jgi:beta-aspartyl-peptidase (threonine type)
MDPERAVTAALSHVARIAGEAGGIVLAPDGTTGWDHNSPHFAVAQASSASPTRVVNLAKRETQ